MTDPMTAATLKVPGAKIYYEVRGTGPVLLMIPGGPTDAGVFTSLSRQLADRYTVVAYDPRGNSRSAFDGEPEEQVLDVHGDDAARLIEALGDGAAYVFGTSGGAAMRQFMEISGMADRPEQGAAPPPVPETPEAIEARARIGRNLEYFLAHGLMRLSLYGPDVDALRAGRARVVVGVGDQSVGHVTYRTGVALAEKL